MGNGETLSFSRGSRRAGDVGVVLGAAFSQVLSFPCHLSVRFIIGYRHPPGDFFLQEQDRNSLHRVLCGGEQGFLTVMLQGGTMLPFVYGDHLGGGSEPPGLSPMIFPLGMPGPRSMTQRMCESMSRSKTESHYWSRTGVKGWSFSKSWVMVTTQRDRSIPGHGPHAGPPLSSLDYLL